MEARELLGLSDLMIKRLLKEMVEEDMLIVEKMKHGIGREIKFLLDSRFGEKAAYSLCEKKNSKMK